MNLLLFMLPKLCVFMIKTFPNPFILRFIETTGWFHKWERRKIHSDLFFTGVWNISSIWSEHYFSSCFIFLPGFTFLEYIKAQVCIFNECLKNQQGFFCHQLAPYFLFLELLLEQKVVTSRVLWCSVCIWEWGKIQESFNLLYITLLYINLITWI